ARLAGSTFCSLHRLRGRVRVGAASEANLLALPDTFRNHELAGGRLVRQRTVQIRKRLLDRWMHALVDLIDLRIIRDGFERDVRNGLVNETGLQAFVRILELVVVVARGHEALFGERDRDARGVAGDPAPTPFFGDKCSSAGAAGRVDYQITWISGHEHAALNNLRMGLDNKGLSFSIPGNGV